MAGRGIEYVELAGKASYVMFIYWPFFFFQRFLDLVVKQLQVLLHIRGGARPAWNLQEHQPGSLASLR